MKRILLYSLFSLHILCADISLDRYFSYMEQLAQPNGNFRQGEIEIVTNLEEIAQLQKMQMRRLLKKGFSSTEAQEFSRIGIVNEDQYWIWLRTAVLSTFQHFFSRNKLTETFMF